MAERIEDRNIADEDDEVFVHPRDPHHGVDVAHSSRLVFETGLPTRYYLRRPMCAWT